MSGPNFHDDPIFIEDSSSDMLSGPPEGELVRPQGLSFICVVAIILGSLGLLTACTGLTSQVFASGIQNAFTRMPGGADVPGADVQREMNARMMAVTNRYKWATMPLMVVKLVVEAALLAGAIMSLGLKPRGRAWLLGGLIAALVFETINAVPMFLIQRETQLVMSEMMPRMMAAQPGANRAPAGFTDFFSTFFSAIGFVAVAVALVWLAAKLIFCAFGITYLRRPDLRALFAPPAE